MLNRRAFFTAIGALACATPGARAASLPRPAPPFKVNMIDGGQLSLGKYKGKVVALAFVLTSCPHCQKAVRSLVESQKEFGPRGFQAIGSAVEEMAQTNLPEFRRLLSPNFPVGYNKLQQALEFMQYPPMVSPYMPLVVFIDREGVIKAQYGGRDAFLAEDQLSKNVRGKILEMLGPPAPPARKSAAPAKRR